MVTIVPIETPTLGDRSYLAHDGEVALVFNAAVNCLATEARSKTVCGVTGVLASRSAS